eukprot:TRINITY_DN1184_c0_g2_i1.p1 TRINITY_DN1184_c0_g2~~TRINITY_DN1184_c0_g2_i1.p1  ORF type:complete len:237 (+),score=87.21 TRINITY_DN1184_c0_g2_i1:81-713(+)
MAGKAPYLHPSQRNLASDGPSNHKNEYHVGVLQGNWVEDRTVFGAQEQPPKFDAKTVAQESFQRPDKRVSHRRDPIPQGEAERQLLFGHGSDFHQTNYTTLNELTYTDLSSGQETVKTGVAFMVTGDSRRNVTAQKKKEVWADETNPERDHYVTQANATLDATATYVKEHKPPAAQCQKKHIVTGQVSASWKKADLRGPFEYKNTPLHRR